MSLRLLFAALLIPLTVGIASPQPAAQQPAVQTTSMSTLDDQAELAVTIYNSDIALVRDVRNIQIARGTSDVQFMDIAATVNPATVHFRSLTEPARVGVVEQNYEYDLLEPDKLLRKYVGREVTLVRTRMDGTTTRDEDVKARLISYNNAPVWEIGGEIVTGMPANHIRFPELPGNLFSHPTLIWTLDNTGGTRHRVEASYLARSLSWIADYVLTVGRDDKSADIDGWVTVTNGSGTSFRNAQLQLVAGDLNRVKSALGIVASDALQRAEAPAAPRMSQESFSEYHLYSLARKTTINNAETKQVSMMGATGCPVQKRYVVDGNYTYYRSAQRTGSPIKDNVEVFYQLKNEEKTGLGMPMPAGTVRVYQSDSNGGLQFVGEDRIDHTPKGETLNLKIGNAFDIISERKQKDFQRIASDVYEIEMEVALRNHKNTPVSVEVNEPIGGDWRMLTSTYPSEKTAAFAAQFKVPIAANGTSTLRYRVRVTY
jgi:hypothetical protein